MAVAARPGDAAERGVYRGDPVAADGLRDWGNAAELPPAFDGDGLLTAATFAPPADCVAAVLLQAGSETPVPDGGAGTERAASDPSAPVGSAAVAVGRAAGGVAAVAGMGRAAGDPFDPIGDLAVAVGRALTEAGVELEAVDDIAVVEHDAATAMLVARALDIDAERINRDGGAVATGNAGAAEDLRLITDGLAVGGSDRLLLTISAGPVGSAAILWRTDI